MLGLLAMNLARKAVTEKVATHLIDKAKDTAEVIDGRIEAFWQYMEGIARMPFLQDDNLSLLEKMKLLEKEAKTNSIINSLYITDNKGIFRREYSFCSK